MVSGAQTASGFKLVAETINNSTTYQFIVARDPEMTNVVYTGTLKTPTTVSTDVGDVYLLKETVTGLSSNELYYYTVRNASSTTHNTFNARCRTFPTGSNTNFKVMLAGDNDESHDSTSIIYGALNVIELYENLMSNEEDILQFSHLGDIHYEDIGSSGSQAEVNGAFREHLIQSQAKFMYSGQGMTYTYDDHDSGPNNNRMDTTGFTNFNTWHRNAINEFFPRYDEPTMTGTGWDDTIAQEWDIGRVRFIMPDVRIYRGSTGLSPTKLLGDGTTYNGLSTKDQKQWIKDRMTAATTDGIKLVVFYCITAWRGSSLEHETWNTGFPVEKAEMGDFFADNDIPELIIVGADTHLSGVDDGDLAANDTTKGKFTAINVGPIKVKISQNTEVVRNWNGDLTDNTYRDDVSYGILEFNDTGSDRIQWTFTNKSLTVGDNPTHNVSNFDANNTVEWDSSTYAVNDDAGTINLRLNKSWLGNASVTVQTADGTATDGIEYDGVNATYTVNANAKYLDIPITINNTALVGTATFTVTISNPDTNSVLGTTVTTTVTITGV